MGYGGARDARDARDEGVAKRQKGGTWIQGWWIKNVASPGFGYFSHTLMRLGPFQVGVGSGGQRAPSLSGSGSSGSRAAGGASAGRLPSGPIRSHQVPIRSIRFPSDPFNPISQDPTVAQESIPQQSPDLQRWFAVDLIPGLDQ